ncbi:MAG: ELM1/GtrOC1 family putative glycosyltransferase [Pseudomonadota bacterium]
MPPLRILHLKDHRPGHYHLAEGVIAAIARRRTVAVNALQISRARWFPNRLMASAIAAGLPGRALLRTGFGVAAADLVESDLVIAAGGDTMGALVGSARHLRARAIYCGTWKHFATSDVDLVVTSYDSHAERPRHLVALKPSGIDPDAIGPPIAPAAFNVERPPAAIGLLIGGDSGLFTYAREDWDALFALIEDLHAGYACRFVVSTSRRTPAPVGDRLQALANRAGETTSITTLIDYRTAGPGTLPQVFRASDAILCTADSSSMISEAISARRPVLGLVPQDNAFKPEEAAYRAMMETRHWCRFVPLRAVTPDALLQALETLSPMQEHHLDALAQRLAERLPTLFEN